jgi:hypothetical protein
MPFLFLLKTMSLCLILATPATMQRRGEVAASEPGPLHLRQVLQRITISAFTRVFDAL